MQEVRGRVEEIVHDTEKWREEGGISILFGMQTSHFPNFFIVSTPQAGMAANQQHPLNVQSRHIAYIIGQARQRGAATAGVVAFHRQLPREDPGKVFKRRLRDPSWQQAGRRI
jgi:hypothetical protein